MLPGSEQPTSTIYPFAGLQSEYYFHIAALQLYIFPYVHTRKARSPGSVTEHVLCRQNGPGSMTGRAEKNASTLKPWTDNQYQQFQTNNSNRPTLLPMAV